MNNLVKKCIRSPQILYLLHENKLHRLKFVEVSAMLKETKGAIGGIGLDAKMSNVLSPEEVKTVKHDLTNNKRLFSDDIGELKLFIIDMYVKSLTQEESSSPLPVTQPSFRSIFQ